MSGFCDWITDTDGQIAFGDVEDEELSLKYVSSTWWSDIQDNQVKVSQMLLDLNPNVINMDMPKRAERKVHQDPKSDFL